MAAFFSLVIILGLAAGAAAFFFHDIFIILMTSFIGSYKVIRGLSYFIGGFPKEVETIRFLKLSDTMHPYYNKAYYGYFAGILILFGLSTYFQFWKRNQTSLDEPTISDAKAVQYQSLPEPEDRNINGINDSEVSRDATTAKNTDRTSENDEEN